MRYETTDGEDAVEIIKGRYLTFTRGTREPLYQGDDEVAAAESLEMTIDDFRALCMSDPA